MINSLTNRILFAITTIIIIIFVSILILTNQSTIKALDKAYLDNSRNIVKSVKLNVESKYQSIIFHKKESLEKRKQELKNIVDIAYIQTNLIYKEYLDGKLSEEQAIKKAKENLRQIRYDNNVGYLWINDFRKPIPHLLMHPIMPELENRTLDFPKYYIAPDTTKHIFQLFTDICNNHGEGFIEYTWPKPNSKNQLEFMPKVSYVKHFERWDWVIGSGVYFDDIEKDAEERLEAVIQELTDALSKIRIAKSGYLYIFSGDYKVIVHPNLKRGTDLHEVMNRGNDTTLARRLMEASGSSEAFTYMWNMPGELENYNYEKSSTVVYFEPLDWYICSAVYVDEVEEPSKQLMKKILLLTLFVICIAILFSYFLSKGLSLPLIKLSEAARKITIKGIGTTKIPIGGTKETRGLGRVIRQMLASIKNSNDNLQRERDFTLELINISPAFIFVIDFDAKLIMMNRVMCKALSFDNECVVGVEGIDFMDSFLSVSEKKRFADLISDHKKNDIQIVREFQLNTQNGTSILVELHSSRIIQNDKKHIILVGLDITKRRKTEDELMHHREHLEDLVSVRTNELKETFDELKLAKHLAESANKAKSEFLANMSHEIRTPLNAILGFSEIMHNEEDSPQKKSFLEIILKSGNNLLKLINDVLDLSRVEAGRMIIDINPVFIPKLLKEISGLFSLKIQDKGLQFTMDISSNLNCFLEVDEARVRQLLVNLVGNAIKFTDEGFIKIKADYVVTNKELFLGDLLLTIQDTGIGIPKHEEENVFSAFGQMSNQDSKKYGGTGLGLAITKRLVTMMNGEIRLDSKVGLGSKFTIVLKDIKFRIPSNQSELTKESTEISEVEFKPAKILIVDDIEYNQKVLKGLLLGYHFEFLFAENGEECISMLEKEPVDLILLDMKMPVMDGYECADLIKKNSNWSKIPIIAVSASVLINEEERALQNCESYIPKPINKKTLIEELMNFLPYEVLKDKGSNAK